jgi:hypothetical protein
VLAANARIGAEIKLIPKATPNPKKPKSPAREIRSGRAATGVKKNARSRLQKIAAIPKPELPYYRAHREEFSNDKR